MATPAQTYFELITTGNVTETNGAVRAVKNIFHLYRGAPASTFSNDHLISAFHTAVWNGVIAALDPTYITAATTLRDMSDSTVPAYVGAVPTTNSNTSSGRLPLQSVVEFQLKVAARGRGLCSYKRFSPIPASSVVNEELSGTGVIAAWKAIGVSMCTAIVDSDGNGYTIGLVSPSQSKLTNPTNIKFYDFVHYNLYESLRSQKKRSEKPVKFFQ